jgi:hypothetical protein
MKGHPGFLFALLGLVLTTSLSVAIIFAIRSAEGPVYSVATVQAGLADQPQAWVGRTVRVRGLAELCLAGGSAGDLPLFQSCSQWPPSLADPDSGDAREPPLPLTWDTQSQLDWLRSVPLLSRLVPPAPAPHPWTLAMYQVRLQRAPARLCGVPTCYEAQLVDAAP